MDIIKIKLSFSTDEYSIYIEDRSRETGLPEDDGGLKCQLMVRRLNEANEVRVTSYKRRARPRARRTSEL